MKNQLAISAAVVSNLVHLTLTLAIFLLTGALALAKGNPDVKALFLVETIFVFHAFSCATLLCGKIAGEAERHGKVDLYSHPTRFLAINCIGGSLVAYWFGFIALIVGL